MSLPRRLSVLLVIVVIAGLLLSACTPAPAPTKAPVPTAAQAQPTKAPKPTAAPPSKSGGTLRHAVAAATSLDPAFLTSKTDDEVTRQWADFFVYIGEDNSPDKNRSLAEDWQVDATGLVWTFKLRQGVKFHNGKGLTSKDVKFTFDRLRDPNVGTALKDMYANITDISTPDDYTVAFTLKNPNPELLKDLGAYQAVVVDSETKDFKTEHNGTGPFVIESYLPEDRIVFKRNPNYWMKDAEGNQLPYLDGMEFIFMEDASAQVEALRGGQVDYLMYLPAEFVPALKQDPNVAVYEMPSNLAYVIHMRSDRAPANDPKVRQALKLATDRKALLDGAIGGLGVTGRDTPIGPMYTDYYLDDPEPARDVAKAKQLLAEAGYAGGLTIDLYAQQASPVPAIATIWKEQLAEAGVTVNIKSVPSDVYYGADNQWLEVDFGITDWGSRPYPQPYLDQAYTCAAQWNESHWCDQELDTLAAKAAQEIDPAKRADLYKQIQKIFEERGPVIVPFFVNNLWAASAKLKGIQPTAALGTAVDLRTVYFEK